MFSPLFVPHSLPAQNSTAQGDATFNNVLAAEFVTVTDFSLPVLDTFAMEYYGACVRARTRVRASRESPRSAPVLFAAL